MLHQIKDGILLRHGDCLDGLLAACNACITDPPYESHMHESKQGARGIRTDGYESPKPVDFEAIGSIREQITKAIIPTCSGWFIAFCTPEGIAPWRDAIEAAKGKYKRALFWSKPDAAPQFNGQGPAMAVEAMVSAWCGTGHSQWNGGGRRNLFTHLTNNSNRDGRHPTEKPLSLMMELVELFTNQGDLVFDPFMGSGTTGVACVRLGRKFHGIEKDKKYFDVAVERMTKAAQQPDMFIDREKPVQEKFVYEEKLNEHI